MNKRTCTIEGCAKPHRARGLCATHYNQTHQPNRHMKKLVPCAYCGTGVLKGTGGGRVYGAVCSDECRVNLRVPPTCALPSDHPVLWIGKSSTWPRYGWRECAFCNKSFSPRAITSTHCSSTCMWRTSKGVKHTYEELAARVMTCGRCGKEFQSPHYGRSHCSDLCRELDREDRGVRVYHGWISKAQRIALYERDNYMCWICNEPCDMEADPQRDGKAPTLDHIVPRSKGGTHEPSNLLTACRSCNSRRQDIDAAEFKASLIELACG